MFVAFSFVAFLVNHLCFLNYVESEMHILVQEFIYKLIPSSVTPSTTTYSPSAILIVSPSPPILPIILPLFPLLLLFFL
jgi:hypothetical protein